MASYRLACVAHYYYSDESYLSPQGMLHFSQAKWYKLHILKLENNRSPNKIGNLGCKYLSRTFLPQL